jgi:hypothetical protein
MSLIPAFVANTPQLFVARTIQAPATVTGITYSGNKLVVVATHALAVNDIVRISGVVGCTEANATFVVASVSTTVSFDVPCVEAAISASWSSGGTVTHIGFASPAVLVDNTVFTNGIPDLTLVSRLEALTTGNARIVWEDAADASFITAEPLWVETGIAPVAANFSADKRWSSKKYDVADIRAAASGDNLRMKVFLSGGTGAEAQVSGWVEY